MPARNRRFLTREPFRNDDRLTLQRAEGPFGFLNPTRAHFNHAELSSASTSGEIATPHESGDDAEVRREPPKQDTESNVPAKNVRFLWRSRDNRKGRHPLLVQEPLPGEEAPFMTPRRTSHPKEILKNIIKTFTYYPVWDISWLVAFIFTWGSVVWVLNSFFVWLPLVAPSTEFDGEIYYGGGVTAFIGAIVFFELGSILLVIEAVNADNSGCFGWAVEQLVDNERNGNPKLRVVANRHHCRHHHQNRANFVGKPSASALTKTQSASNSVNGEKHWQWFPSWHDLRTHYLHELGFLAGAAQLFGATVFGVSGFTALPGINNHLTPQWRLNAAYWIPQVIGGSGFIVSSTLYMLETQQKWWKPALHLLGWHIAFWNLVGAFGFTLCGALGMAYNNSGAQFQAGLATFW
ncbi:integral membrane [Trichoderma arundinaceum]|uniref:Integral membrane n=1 Tax=Trichoderma arundinaceum TaxID=490622 RepID=A0A395NH98_TRIAR|nr:integral membrane [Trichoderma arundinaceum]